MTTRGPNEGERLTLRQWAWRNFVATTLMPLLLVEAVLLCAYLGMSLHTHHTTTTTLRAQARQQLSQQALAEASALGARLGAVEQLVAVFSRQTLGSLQAAAPIAPTASYAYRGDGSYVSAPLEPDRSAVFYSGLHPVGEAEREKAHRTEALEPLMVSVMGAEPLAVQIYLNTHDALTRIFPPVHADEFPPRMDTPSYNFYYEADAVHNPGRGVVWTETYLDPIGAGWITSAIAPVYHGDHLEAVVGIDVTVQKLLDGVLDLDIPWGGHPLLVSPKGTLLAVSPEASAALGMESLPKSSSFDGVIGRDTVPDAYNLRAQPASAGLADLLDGADAGVERIALGGARLVSWARVGGTGWDLAIVVEEAAIYAAADTARADALRLGKVLAVGIVLFYVVFLFFLYRRAWWQVSQVTEPLQTLRATISEISAGRYAQPPVHAPIAEIDQTAVDVIEMGHRLGAQVDALTQKEAALREAIARAASERSARLARSRFLANVSHEIRTPMNGILGILELLESDIGASHRESIRMVRGSARTLLRLIDDLLDASKIEAGKLTLEQRPVSLGATLHSVTQLFRVCAEDKGLQLRCDVGAGVPGHVMTDELRLRQVVSNLLSNAIKFTPSGEVSLAVAVAPGGLRFSVTDAGVGIEPSRIQRILEPFTQADESTTRRFGGTGLGLSISVGIVRALGGTLEVDSAPGEGTCFSFTVPLEACAAPTPPSTLPAAPDAPPLRILVAEDNPINQLVIQKMLTRLGHTATITADGREALDRYVPGAFDLGLFDVHMPELDGLDLTRRIRAQEAANPDQPRLPILALTASVMAEDVAACRGVGMDECLAKPIEQQFLQTVLSQIRSTPGAKAAQA